MIERNTDPGSPKGSFTVNFTDTELGIDVVPVLRAIMVEKAIGQLGEEIDPMDQDDEWTKAKMRGLAGKLNILSAREGEPYCSTVGADGIETIVNNFRAYAEATEQDAVRQLCAAPDGLEVTMMEDRRNLGRHAERFVDVAESCLAVIRDTDRLEGLDGELWEYELEVKPFEPFRFGS